MSTRQGLMRFNGVPLLWVVAALLAGCGGSGTPPVTNHNYTVPAMGVGTAAVAW